MGSISWSIWLCNSEEMTPTEWAGFGAGVCAVLTSLLLGLRWVIKSYLSELKSNGGSSLRDSIDRLEKRVDDLFVLISKS
jgi:hypothetical protein